MDVSQYRPRHFFTATLVLMSRNGTVDGPLILHLRLRRTADSSTMREQHTKPHRATETRLPAHSNLRPSLAILNLELLVTG
jgi:hypothetical protein